MKTPKKINENIPTERNSYATYGGFMDWNEMTFENMVSYLEDKYKFDSSGEAKCIFELIDFYNKHK